MKTLPLTYTERQALRDLAKQAKDIILNDNLQLTSFNPKEIFKTTEYTECQ